MLGERKLLGVSVVASFPRKSAAKSLKPRIEGDGQDQKLSYGMEKSPQIALSEAVSQGEAESEDDGDFGPNNRPIGRSKEKSEGKQE